MCGIREIALDVLEGFPSSLKSFDDLRIEVLSFLLPNMRDGIRGKGEEQSLGSIGSLSRLMWIAFFCMELHHAVASGLITCMVSSPIVMTRMPWLVAYRTRLSSA